MSDKTMAAMRQRSLEPSAEETREQAAFFVEKRAAEFAAGGGKMNKLQHEVFRWVLEEVWEEIVDRRSNARLEERDAQAAQVGRGEKDLTEIPEAGGERQRVAAVLAQPWTQSELTAAWGEITERVCGLDFYRKFGEHMAMLGQPEAMKLQCFDNAVARLERELLADQRNGGYNMAERDDEMTAARAEAAAEMITVRLYLSNAKMNRTVAALAERLLPSSQAPWGLNHVGLQLGSTIVDWNDGNLVFPREIRSSNAKSLLPMVSLPARIRDPASATGELMDTRLRICQLICEVNRTWEYSALTCNCHHFVSHMMRNLGIQPAWETGGAIEAFLNYLRLGASLSSTAATWRLPHPLRPAGEFLVVNSHPELRAVAEQLRAEGFDVVPPPVAGDDPRRREYHIIFKSIERALQMQEKSRKGSSGIEPGKEMFGNVFTGANE